MPKKSKGITDYFDINFPSEITYNSKCNKQKLTSQWFEN